MQTEMSSAKDSLVVWLDAGDVLRRRLDWLRVFTVRRGFYSPYSSGTIEDWTHPLTLTHLRADQSVLPLRNLSGGIMAVDPRHEVAMRVIQAWAECARTRECIVPVGSSRLNHRQDQAVLTVLARQHGLVSDGLHQRNSAWLGISIHRDAQSPAQGGQ
ncbi:MAG: hypothetical protein WCK21_09605 [Actinomycetota bacterium]